MKPLVLTAILLTAGVAQAQSSQDLLQEALRLERSQGDLSGAIAIYEQITDDPAGERGTTARALFNLGRVYEALGRDEATRAYRRLVREYAEYSELVAGAQERLRALAPAVAPAEADVNGPTIVEVPIPQEVLDRGHWGTALTPDGMHILNVDWLSRTGLDLTLTDLKTGKVEHLGVTDGQKWPAFPRMSRDHRYVAFLQGEGTGEEAALKVLDREQGSVRTLFEGEAWLELFEWTPDGSEILARVPEASPTGEMDFVAIRVSDGERRTIGRYDYFDALCTVSGGRYVLAYSSEGRNNDAWPGFRIDLSDGAVVPWQEMAFEVHWLGCDDEFAYGKTDGLGVPGVWRWPLEDGLLSGREEYVAPETGISYGIGLSQDLGLVAQASDPSMLFVAPIEANTGRLTGPIEVVNRRYTWGVHGWSQDGETLATGSGTSQVVRLIDSEGRTDLLKADGLEYGAGRVFWMADNRRLVVTGGWNTIRPAAQQVVLTERESGAVVAEYGSHILLDVLGDDALLVETRPSDRESCIARFDKASGETSTLHCGPFARYDYQSGFFGVSVSPDDSSIITATDLVVDSVRTRVMLQIDTSTGDTETIMKMERSEGGFYRPTWLPDGSGIVYSKWLCAATCEGADLSQFYEVMNLDTGATSEWFPQMSLYHRLSGFAIHPDGDKVAFAAWPPETKTRLIRIAGL